MIVLNMSILFIGIIVLIVTLFQVIQLLFLQNKKISSESNSNIQFKYNVTRNRLIVSLVLLIIFTIINSIIILK